MIPHPFHGIRSSFRDEARIFFLFFFFTLRLLCVWPSKIKTLYLGRLGWKKVFGVGRGNESGGVSTVVYQTNADILENLE